MRALGCATGVQRCLLWCSAFIVEDVAVGQRVSAAASTVAVQRSRPELLDQIYRLESRITALTAENTTLAARNTELEARNTELATRLARCEHLLSRNSGNSSMPPSTDDAVGRTPPPPPPPPAAAPRGDGPRRRRGKQPGAPGTTLGWTDHPTRRVDLFPHGVCGCGRDLAQAVDDGVVASHQQHDIPPVEVIITQYDLHRVRCGCGKTHTPGWAEATPAGTPAGVGNNTVSWGPNTQAVCVFLLSEHHLPVRRVADVIHALAGRSPSTGFIHGLIGRVAGRIQQAGISARIRGALGVAPAVCVDETPIRVGPAQRQPGGLASKKYLHVACTDSYTDYLVGDRGLDTITATVIPALPESVVLVHDRYSAYDSPVLGTHTHQLCVAHLLRNLAAAAQAYPGQDWAQQISWSLRGLIHAANTARDRGGGIDPVCRDRWMMFFRSGVQIGLAHTGPTSTSSGGGAGVGPGQRSTRLLLETLRDRESDVVGFAHNPYVPATSNQAERDVRPAKLAQKISGRFTSITNTKNRYVIKGYTSTANKHGISAFAALQRVIAGRPWMPPSPAPV